MKRTLLCLTLCALVLAGFSCAAPAPAPASPSAPAPTGALGVRETVTIMVPQDETAYVNEIDQSGADPASVNSMPFVKKDVTVMGSGDPLRDAAQAAANEIKAGPDGAQDVVYFKVVNGAAYVELRMDVDAWAGVSFAILKTHPLVEQTLLAQPGVFSVGFGVAPGDSQQAVIDSLSQPVAPTGR